MYAIVWEFLPAPGREREFEAAYAPTGPWVELFRRAAGYVGSELIPPHEAGGWYRTIDRWESREAFEAFRRAFGPEYGALDGACERLTLEERPVSSGSTVP